MAGGVISFCTSLAEISRHAVLSGEAVGFTAPPGWERADVHAVLWDSDSGNELFRFEPLPVDVGDTYEVHPDGRSTVTA